MKNIFSILFIVMSMETGLTNAQSLQTGDKAPIFQALDENGKPWDASQVYGKGFVVVYFYPAAMTGGCTAQACAYRDSRDELAGLGVTVVGISGDKPENLVYFKKANNLNFTLLSDEDGKVAKSFGVETSGGDTIEREIDGKTVTLERGITTKRWTFIVGKEGKIVYIDKTVNAPEDSKNTLNKIKELLSKE
jgi:thioredoxin-dependent peroxiredoxin